MDVIEMQFADQQITEQAMTLLAPLAKQVTQQETSIKLYVEDGAHQLPELVRVLDSGSLYMTSLNLAPPSLDDVFIQVTGKQGGGKLK
jgi:ABC-2 type transport system ATP-binding protein